MTAFVRRAVAIAEGEDRHVALHIGAVAVFAGPAPSHDEVYRRYVRVVAGSPHYRQVLRHVPFELGRPRWVDTGEVDLDYHLRRTALPAPGFPGQLEQVAGRLMSQQLDPDRPLWEAWVIEGLDAGRWALLTKVHHSLVDGLGGMALFAELLDANSETDADLGTDVGSDQGTEDTPSASAHRPSATQLLRDTVTLPRMGVDVALSVIGGGVRLIRSLRPTSATSLTGVLGTPRRYRMLSLPLEDVHAVRTELGGTVNDVVLTLVTRGFHELLLARGEVPRPDSVHCLVPASTRTDAEEDTDTDRISLSLVDLPVEYEDPVIAHDLVRTRTAQVTASGHAPAGGHGLSAVDLLPPPLVTAAMRLLRRPVHRVVTTIATNVPGPRTPQMLLGRRMVALYPWVPIAEGIQIAVAVTSYRDQLHVGVTCDWDAVPDVDVFARAFADGLTALTTHYGQPDPQAGDH